MRESNNFTIIRVLLVEGDEQQIEHIKKLLAQSEVARFELTIVKSLMEAIETDTQGQQVALVNLSLPDNQGLSTAKKFKNAVPDIPTVAMTDVDDEIFTLTAIQAGIQDCIVIGEFTKNMLVRTLCFAVERDQALKVKDDATTRTESHFLSHDQLTGLPNKRFLIDFLNTNIASDVERKKHYMIVNLQFEGLQQVNYTLGISYADTLLKNIAKRLEALYGGRAIVVRPEAYQLLLLFEEAFNDKQIAELADNLLVQLREPITILEERVLITTNMGVSRYPEDTQDPEDLIEKAYLATRVAKEIGWHEYCIYSNSIAKQVEQYTAILTDLKSAEANNEFFFLIQPKVDLKTGKVARGEVLIRWQHPRLGLISPGQFIKIAEETNTIVSIGDWLLRKSLALISKAVKENKKENVAPIDINVSSAQLAQIDFIDSIESILKDYPEVAPYLGFEITETTIMSNQRDAQNILSYLQKNKIHISIDDFGTGYSSLSYLKHLPVNAVKIDRSFINQVHRISQNAAITKSTIKMVHNLGLEVVAEGVEKKEELEFLVKHGCDQVQGFYFAKPMLPDTFFAMIKGEPFELPARDEGL
jgi:diguanylate cyclase (GGDEF)-like protein